MKMITLSSGEEIPETVYVAVSLSLKILELEELLAMVDVARYPRYRLSGEMSATLHRKGLPKNGKMHDAVRAVILDMYPK